MIKHKIVPAFQPHGMTTLTQVASFVGEKALNTHGIGG
jgi:hypothetical protein